MLLMPKIKELSFLVYGLGTTGRSVAKFLIKNKIKKFNVWDDKEKNSLKNYRPKNLLQVLNQVDFIVLSPGISLLKNKNLRKFKKKIITDIDLFYLTKNRPKSIVVTGTNGKSTTCKLLEHLLKKNKYKIFLGGNIGTPILNLKDQKKNFAIIEASSFQLSHSKFICPNYAIFLNFSNDHLDWHGSKKSYLNSKFRIFRLQNKNHYALINKNLRNIFRKKNFVSKLILPREKDYENIKFKIKNDYLTSNINYENMSFIYTFSKLMRIKDENFIKSMKSFKGLSHRFEIFLKRNGITFINDSKATSFKATDLALTGLKNIYWILGGLPKEGDRITISKHKKNIIKCYLIGKDIKFFKNQIKNKLVFSITKNLKNSVIKILKDCKLKKNISKFVLLSPASASFYQFPNFEQRGEEFKRLCNKYAK